MRRLALALAAAALLVTAGCGAVNRGPDPCLGAVDLDLCHSSLDDDSPYSTAPSDYVLSKKQKRSRARRSR
jgi:hypothetical protein